MRRLIALCMVGLMMSASTAAGITFTENWDSYAAGVGPGGPWVLDPHNSAMLPVTSDQSQSPDNSLHVHGNGALSDKGIYALLTVECAPDEVVAGTDANPLALEYSVYYTHNRVNRDPDYLVELSLGDVHAPAFVLGAPPLDDPIPVLAWCAPRFDKKSHRYFDGTQWLQVEHSGIGLVWMTASMTVKTNTVDLVSPAGLSYPGVARAYTGAFDRINIHVEDDSGTNHTYLDDLSVTGGVCIPEPVTLMLLGVGGLLLRRRR